MELRVYIVLEHVSGPELDQDTALDALCATIGKDNGAKDPVRVTTRGDFDRDEESVYIVKLVDDRKPV